MAKKNKTTAQTVVNRISAIFGDNTLVQRQPVSYDTYRTIRKHPTVSMARNLSIAPILAGEWTIEGPSATDAAVEYAQAQILRHRTPYLKHALYGCYDYGWAAFERYGDNIKPLLPDFTHVMIDEWGHFLGLEQASPTSIEHIYLDEDEAVFVSVNAEAGEWYGTGILEIIRPHYDNWEDCNTAAARYDNKLAGTMWVVKYPDGDSEDRDGNVVPNGILAQQVLSALEASGKISIPQADQEILSADLNKRVPLGWQIEMLDSPAKQTSFIDRLNYLDKLFVRAFNLPERAILEGEFGTKAEAGVHQNIALLHMDQVHRDVTQIYYEQVLYKDLRDAGFNPDSVSLSPAPLAPTTIDHHKSVLDKLIDKDIVNTTHIDVDALMDIVGLPKREVIV